MGNRSLAALAILGLTACGGGDADEPARASMSAGGEVEDNQNAPAPTTYVAPAGRLGGSQPESAELAGATSHERPLPACGPADSYRRVAEYRCPDGSVPLGGDPARGASARSGNVGPNSTGHVIDLYRVPCPGGDVELYVDMYSCPETQRLLVP